MISSAKAWYGALSPGRRRGLWAGLLVIAVLLLRLIAQGGVPGLFAVDETWSNVQTSGVLRVGMDASYPPFESVTDAGEFLGFDVDLSRALAERWGAEVQFVNVHFDGLYDALKTDKFDIIVSALPYDRTMTQDLAYSYSYYNAGQVLLTRADSGYGLIADLSGQPVAVELGSEGHQILRQLNRDDGMAFEIVAERELATAAQAVVAGEASGMVCNRVDAYSLMVENAGLQVTGEPLTDEPFVIAAPLGASTTMEEINAAIAEWSEDGTLDALAAKWF